MNIYEDMRPHEIEAAQRIERVIAGTVGCHFSSECIMNILNMLLPSEIIKRKP